MFWYIAPPSDVTTWCTISTILELLPQLVLSIYVESCSNSKCYSRFLKMLVTFNTQRSQNVHQCHPPLVDRKPLILNRYPLWVWLTLCCLTCDRHTSKCSLLLLDRWLCYTIWQGDVVTKETHVTCHIIITRIKVSFRK